VASLSVGYRCRHVDLRLKGCGAGGLYRNPGCLKGNLGKRVRIPLLAKEHNVAAVKTQTGALLGGYEDAREVIRWW